MIVKATSNFMADITIYDFPRLEVFIFDLIDNEQCDAYFEYQFK